MCRGGVGDGVVMMRVRTHTRAKLKLFTSEAAAREV